MKYLESSKSQRQKEEWALPVDGWSTGIVGYCSMGIKFYKMKRWW